MATTARAHHHAPVRVTTRPVSPARSTGSPDQLEVSPAAASNQILRGGRPKEVTRLPGQAGAERFADRERTRSSGM